MDTSPYVSTPTILLHHFNSFFENRPSHKKIRIKISGKTHFHLPLYCDLPTIDPAIGGYDFPKQSECYVVATVNNNASKKTPPLKSTAPSWDEILYL